MLGGEGAEVFDVDGGHFDGDGFLFREKHCRNKKEEKELNIQREMKKKVKSRHHRYLYTPKVAL